MKPERAQIDFFFLARFLLPSRPCILGSVILATVRSPATDPSAVRCGRGRLSCRPIVGIHALGISIPQSLLMLLG